MTITQTQFGLDYANEPIKYVEAQMSTQAPANQITKAPNWVNPS